MPSENPPKPVTSLAHETIDRGDGGKRPARKAGANQNNQPRSTLIAKNVVVNGHRTSVRMEPEVWNAIDDICWRGMIDRNHLFTTVAKGLKPHQSLSSAMRVFVVSYYRDSSTENGHVRAGHGPQNRS